MRLSFLVPALFALAACAAEAPRSQPQAQTAPAVASVAPKVETVARGLAFPWGMAFLPDGRLLVTERDGGLRVIANGALDPQPIAGTPDVFVENQGGLLDVAAHPDFASNGLIYLSYAAGTKDANGTRLAQARLDGKTLRDLKVLFDASPSKRGGAHFGGRILFLPDGTLLLSLGDGYAYRNEAQNLGSDLGKVVRLTLEGAAPQDNPFVGEKGARAEIFSLGHRNVQGLARDPASGRLYEAEFGPKGGDELNLLEAGRNYGWPVITYGVDYSGASITPFTERPGMEQPIAYWVPSISPSGIIVYSGDLFPAWKGDVLMAALSGQHLRRVDLDGAGKVVGQEALLEGRARFRDVEQGPDGAVYLLTDAPDGEVLRLTP